MKLYKRLLCLLLALCCVMPAALGEGKEAVDITEEALAEMYAAEHPEEAAAEAEQAADEQTDAEAPAGETEAPAEEAAPGEEQPAAGTATASDLEGEPAPFAGWNKKTKYQYVSFGTYPHSKDGSETAAQLWLVLTVNEEDGTALLFNDDVIDMYPIIWVESKKDRDNHNFRKISDIRESDLYVWMNDTMLNTMFTPAEQQVLVNKDDRGLLYVLDRSEMTNADYGFARAVYGHNIVSRICAATPYAQGRGIGIIQGGSTYWVSGLRPGNPYRMSIVGYNGHISYAGCGRQNVGVRPACLVKMNRVHFASGSGTKEDPYVIEVNE